MKQEPLTFQQRIERRRSIWWGQPGGWRSPGLRRRPIHHLLDTQILRDRSWPLERWRCCDLWQRCLNNKWNSREFAAKHGVAIPALIWYGRDLRKLPTSSFPSRYAVRCVWGKASDQTHLIVDGKELLDNRTCTPDQLKATLQRQYGRWSMHPLLVEEYLEDAAGQPRASQFNFYCFAGNIALIEHVQPDLRSSQRTAYTPDWDQFPEGVHSKRRCAAPIARPKEMDEMITKAGRLAESYGTFVRVDFYLCSKGIYFGEFSSAPFGGKHIRPWANKLLGRLWTEYCPDSI